MKGKRFFICIGIILVMFGAVQLYAVTELEPMWANQYGAVCSNLNKRWYMGYKIAIDSSGNPVVGGQDVCQTGGAMTWMGTVCKYNKTTGNMEWIKEEMLTIYGCGYFMAVATGTDGNIYLLSQGDHTYPGYLFKYSPNGTKLATYGMNGGGGASYNMEIGADGYIYGAGKILQYQGAGSWLYSDFVRKVDPNNGNWILDKYYKRSPYCYDGRFFDVALDSAGNIYVVGDYYGGAVGQTFADMVKFSATGTLIWAKDFTDYTLLSLRDICVKGSYVYATGAYRTVKYDLDGNEIWSLGTSGNKIEVKSNGDIYLRSGGALYKYNSAGVVVWGKTAGAPGTHPCDMRYDNLAMDSRNNVYVTGSASDDSGRACIATYAYRENGDIAWIGKWNSTTALTDDKEQGYGVAVYEKDDSCWVYVTGCCGNAQGDNTYNDIVTLKYPCADNPADITEAGVQISEKYYLEAYPNPLTKLTEIKYELPKSAYVKIELYNLAGRKVTTVAEGEQLAGMQVCHLSGNEIRGSGIYFIKFSAGEYKEIKKIVLMK